jgi:hypothetical protein
MHHGFLHPINNYLNNCVIKLHIKLQYQSLQVHIETMYIVPGSINRQQLNTYQW